MAFAGSVFAPGSSDRRTAQIDLTVSGATVVSEHGRWDLAWRDLRFSHGAMAFLTHADGRIVACDEAGFLLEIATLAPPEIAGEARRFAGRGSRTAFGCGTLLLLALALFAALLVGAWLAIPWAAGRAVEAMPPEVDREIGDRSYEAMDLGGSKVAIPLADEALALIVGRLAPQAKHPFEFRVQVVESEQVNAFCLPGGRIVVYTGLLRKAARAEQVAGVLAHEMAHATLRHGLQGMAKQVGVIVGVQILTGDVTGLAGQIATSALSNSYSRDMEREADAEGARILAAAGIDPHGMAEFFALLGDGPAAVPAWASTHPDHGERVEAIEALIPTLGQGPEKPVYQALAIDWPALQAALVR